MTQNIINTHKTITRRQGERLSDNDDVDSNISEVTHIQTDTAVQHNHINILQLFIFTA